MKSRLFTFIARFTEGSNGLSRRVRPLVDRAFSRWIPPSPDESQGWTADANWARFDQEPLRARYLLRTIAVINDPPILLMDEPTGSMDHSSEEEIKKQLRGYASGKTLIVITHRTSLLDLVDRIIVVDAGKIVADGPKAQVVEALRQGRIGKAS